MIPNTDYNIEEASAVSMQFKSGIFGIMFSACFIQAGVWRSGLDIFCEDGSIEYRLRKSLTLSIAEGQETWGAKNQYTIDMDRTFIEAVRSGDGSRIRSPYLVPLNQLNFRLLPTSHSSQGKRLIRLTEYK